MCRERAPEEGDSIVSRSQQLTPMLAVFHRENWKGDSWDGNGAFKGH